MWPFNRQQRARDIVQGISKPLPYTPDKAILAQSKFRLMFICDDVMRAHKNYKLIRDNSAKVSRGFTQGVFDYRIGKHTGKGLPFMAREGLKIKGELHAVETEHIPELDNHYKNGVEFARCRVKVLVSDRDHQLVNIGSEEFLKHLPPGVIRTVPELNVRHYLSNQFVCVIEADMYIALKKHWADQPKEGLSYPEASIEHPKQPLVWLPKYFKYPIDRNR